MHRNEALLLVGHGSSRYADAAAPLHRHAEALRGTAGFAAVEVALLQGAPSVQQALSRITAPALRVVPFFMEDGYFSRVAVPRALAGRVAAICPPVGVHDGIAGLIERHALAACDSLVPQVLRAAPNGAAGTAAPTESFQWPADLPSLSRRAANLEGRTPGAASRSAAIVLLGHGSSSAPGRALALHRHASRVAATELFARVEAACLEEAPFFADTLARLRGHPVVVIGYFANHGGHVRDDVPALIAAELAPRGTAAPGVRFHGCVTDDPAMVQIIIDQAAERAVATGDPGRE